MKKKMIGLLLGAAVCCIGGASIGTASAYFTTYASAEGKLTIELGTDTTIKEPEVAAGVKHLVVSNTGKQDVYVRAKAFAGGDVTISYSGSSWSDGGDGYYYYSSGDEPAILAAGEETDGDKELLVNFKYNNSDVKPGDSYNVIVIYEATPVQYKADGTAYADWSLSAEVEGGAD